MLHSYKNGNYFIKLYKDGTKERYIPSDKIILKPEFPESVDLKITNFCDLGCLFCHENASIDGKHADINLIKKSVEGLPAGIEIAVGGGNPLSHPLLKDILNYFKHKGFVSNITVNETHLKLKENINLMQKFIDSEIIYGVGISIPLNFNNIKVNINCKNIVAHVIAGIHTFETIQNIRKIYDKVLILGYKTYGRGKYYFSPEITKSIDWLRFNLWKMFFSKYGSGIVSFDNLAIEQLKVWKHFSSENWSGIYMGDDGDFTCYHDAVSGMIKRNSISSGGLNKLTIKEAFQKLKVKKT